MAEAWYTGRPAGLVFGGPGRGGLVFGAPGAWSRAVFGGSARLGHAGVQGAGMPWGRAVFGGPARLGQGGLST